MNRLRNRRVATILVGLVPMLVLAAVGMTRTVPFVAQGPGDLYDILGEVSSGEPVVQITGVPEESAAGSLDMTVVVIRSNLTLFEAMGLWLEGDHALVPTEYVFPPDQTVDEVREESEQVFATAEQKAVSVALGYVGLAEPQVTESTGGGAWSHLLRPGDVIETWNDQYVSTAAELTKALADSDLVAAQQEVTVRRDGRSSELSLPPLTGAAAPPVQGSAFGISPDLQTWSEAIWHAGGVAVADKTEEPVEVTFNIDERIGGPSAGLIFTLSVIDKLTPGDLTGGKAIAGTGEISETGQVGPIGGIRHKISAAHSSGAAAMLVPAENCQEALDGAPADFPLIVVESVPQAVSALEDFRDGKPVRTCAVS